MHSINGAIGFGSQHGYYTDTGTGLLCLTHRYYDPGTGRFVNRDPIGYKGGINLYGFAGNNPVNESDPSGFSEAGDVAGVVGLVPGPIGEAANLASGLDSLHEGDYLGRLFRWGAKFLAWARLPPARRYSGLPTGCGRRNVRRKMPRKRKHS